MALGTYIKLPVKLVGTKGLSGGSYKGHNVGGSSGSAQASGQGAGQNGNYALVDAAGNCLAVFKRVPCAPSKINAALAEQVAMMNDAVTAINADH
jgi:hypothetical protein